MTTDPFEILSAFVDGESVDPSELAEALAAPGSREALIDFMKLRGLLRADPAIPSAEFYAGMETLLGGSRAPRRSRWPRRIAAGLAASGLFTIGLFMGLELRGPSDSGSVMEVPPTPTREVRFIEGVDWFRS